MPSNTNRIFELKIKTKFSYWEFIFPSPGWPVQEIELHVAVARLTRPGLLIWTAPRLECIAWKYPISSVAGGGGGHSPRPSKSKVSGNALTTWGDFYRGGITIKILCIFFKHLMSQVNHSPPMEIRIWKLCTDQFETSTCPLGRPQEFDYKPCRSREFDIPCPI